MTDDLIKRMRDWVPAEGPPEGRTAPDAVADMHEAADRIEALQAENAKLRDALFPFAEFHQLGGSMNDPISMWFRVAPFADAAYALQETER